MNAFLAQVGDRRGQVVVEMLLKDLDIEYRAHGLDQIPVGGRYQFVSNHPLGALDGITMLDAIGRRFGDARFPVNDLLCTLQVFDPLFVPVNSYGPATRAQALGLDQAYAGDCPLVIFPAGICSRRVKGEITDLPWKKTFAQKSVEHRRDIVPVYFDARNTKRFYRLASWRKRLGIKLNIEMFFLPDEMYRKRGARFDIYFGKPIPHTELGQGTPAEWTRRVREAVFAMAPGRGKGGKKG